MSKYYVKVRQPIEEGDNDFLVFAWVDGDKVIRPCSERMETDPSGHFREYFLTFKVLNSPEGICYKLGSIWASADEMIVSIDECED